MGLNGDDFVRSLGDVFVYLSHILYFCNIIVFFFPFYLLRNMSSF